MKFGKTILGLGGVVLASIGTLLFQPTVFCEITIPVTAKLAGWKARAVSARLSVFGKLEVEGLEAVNKSKSRIAMDTAEVEFDLLQVLTGRPEILRADFRFAMVDLEVTLPKEKKKGTPFSIPFSLREATVELVEGRLRTETGAWILKSAHASAEGWDGKTPREIRLQLGHLDWNGPGQQELATTTQATAQKSKDPTGGDFWDIKLTTDVSTVVDLPPWNLVAPCQLVLEGKATRSPKDDWRVDGLKAVWQGVGGIRLAAKVGGTYGSTGDWTAEIDLEPTDLQLAGIFLQPRGIQNVYGSVGGVLNLRGGPRNPLGVGVELKGQTVQLVAEAGTTWPPQPATLALSSRGEWKNAEGILAMENLSLSLIRAGQPADLQLSLDRPAVLQLAGAPQAQASEPASLQWTLRGLEIAALAPIFLEPAQLKVEGGKLSASGSARIEGAKVGLTGRVESRSLAATGSWVQGKLAFQSASLDFQGYLEKASKLHLENAQLRAAWEGGATEDLAFNAKAEWDSGKNEGFLAGDLTVGLVGLGKAWAGAQFWPEDGLAKAHVEFSGNPHQKGSGLVSLTLSNMRWPGEKAGSWEAKLSSEVEAEQGAWTLPELVMQANRAGTPLLDGKVSAMWNPALDMGRIRVGLEKAESAFVVPLLKNFTPSWQWSEAAGAGSFEFTRQDKHDRVVANLQAAVTVETGTPQRPRPVDFSFVQGNVQASWPSGTAGVLTIDALALVAKHRDGTEAVRASLDAPLALEKKGPDEWQPAGAQACSGVIQFGGWPMGILAPLVLPKATENSIAGTLSGFVRVQSDPARGHLQAELDVSSPDFSVALPELRLADNRTSVKAEAELGSDRNLVIRKVMVASQQAGKDWLELSAEKAAQPALAVVGKADLAILAQNVPSVAPYVSAGVLVLRANVGEPKAGVRRIGFSTEAQDLALSLPGIGAGNGLKAKALGTCDWGKEGVTFLDDLQLTADGFGGSLQIGKLDWKKGGAVSWDSARVSEGWVAFLAGAWLQPNRWVDGDLVLGQGFWEPGNHGSSGQIDATLVEARISDQRKLAPLSVRLGGDWEYDTRTHLFVLKDASVLFPEFRDHPVQIPSLQAGPGFFQIKADGGTLDLRGLVDQGSVWRSALPVAGAKTSSMRLDISANLDRVVLEDASVGPVKISKFRYGPEGILLEPSSVEVQGGLIRGSVVQTGGGDRPLQARLFIEKFPLGAILSPMIQDARGPLGGFVDLQFTGQASGARIEDLQRSLAGQGNFRMYQAHLENLPAIAKALQAAGIFLGSNLVGTSEINDLGGSFSVQGSNLSTEGIKVVGTAAQVDLAGQMDWVTQKIKFRGPVLLTREAMNSSAKFQAVMTKLISSSKDYYTKLPGDLVIEGTISKPDAKFDEIQAGFTSILNVLGNSVPAVLDGAGGAAGAAAGAASGLFQAIPFFGR